MTWTSLAIAIAVCALLLAWKRSGKVSRGAAADYLRQGAVVIDVRSAGEFTAGHLPRAVNIPLSEIEAIIARKVKDKHQVMLLHCQSGMRSGAAKRKLKSMGYEHVFDLGSYRRAADILSRQAK